MQNEGETHSRACTPQSMTMPARLAPSFSVVVTMSMERPSCVVPMEEMCPRPGYLDSNSLVYFVIWSLIQ